MSPEQEEVVNKMVDAIVEPYERYYRHKADSAMDALIFCQLMVGLFLIGAGLWVEWVERTTGF